MGIKVSRPRSPTVAEELAEAARDNNELYRVAMRRASVLAMDGPATRFTFEDGSCIAFNSELRIIKIQPNCKE